MDLRATGLFVVPPEVLDEIASYLSGPEVHFLWLSGHKRLMYNMSAAGGIKRLTLSRSGISIPHALSVGIPPFSHLQELAIVFTISQSVAFDPSSLSSTIRSLRLCFREAERCWKDIPTAKLLPDLEELDLNGLGDYEPVYLHQVPTTLKSLRLRAFDSHKVLAMIKALPVGLEHLSLPRTTKIKEQALRALPQNLKTLLINRSHVWPSLLPKDLTNISFCVPRVDDTEEMMARLPRSLTTLNIHVNFCADSVARITSADLPRGITSLQLSGAPFDMVLKDLPRDLKHFVITRSSFKRFDSLPPNLQHLSMIGSDVPVKADVAELLPRTLQTWALISIPTNELLVVRLNDSSIPKLPPLITKLVIASGDEITGASFRNLPRALIYLELPASRNILNEDIAHLPKYLEHLKLYEAEQLGDPCARLLPRGLRSFMVLKSPHFTVACIPDLPPHLDNLNLGSAMHEISTQYSRHRYSSPKSPQ